MHHVVEKRFAETLGIDKPGRMLSVALTPEEHKVFTNLWQAYIPRGIDYAKLTRQDIWSAAQKIYVDHPELLEAAQQTIFGQ